MVSFNESSSSESAAWIQNHRVSEVSVNSLGFGAVFNYLNIISLSEKGFCFGDVLFDFNKELLSEVGFECDVFIGRELADKLTPDKSAADVADSGGTAEGLKNVMSFLSIILADIKIVACKGRLYEGFVPVVTVGGDSGIKCKVCHVPAYMLSQRPGYLIATIDEMGSWMSFLDE